MFLHFFPVIMSSFYFLWSLWKLLLVGCSTSWINLLIFLSFLFFFFILCLSFYSTFWGTFLNLLSSTYFESFKKNWLIIFLISRNSKLFSECTFYDCTFLVLWIIISPLISLMILITLSLKFFMLSTLILLPLCSDLFYQVGWFSQFLVILNCLFTLMSKGA